MIGNCRRRVQRNRRNMHQRPAADRRDKVRFVGEPVAVVVAETKEIALQGARKVHVDYRRLPAVFECREAIASGAPLIHNQYSASHPRKL